MDGTQHSWPRHRCPAPGALAGQQLSSPPPSLLRSITATWMACSIAHGEQPGLIPSPRAATRPPSSERHTRVLGENRKAQGPLEINGHLAHALNACKFRQVSHSSEL